MLIAGATCGLWPHPNPDRRIDRRRGGNTTLPFGPLRLVLDPLAAFFLLPIFL